MKYLKLFESYQEEKEQNKKRAIEHFEKITDLLSYNNYSLDRLDIKDDAIYYGDNQFISLDKDGNVYLNYTNRPNLIERIGSVQLNSIINDMGEIENLPEHDFKYLKGIKKGKSIKLGDVVLVDGEYGAFVESFFQDKVYVIDGDEDYFLVDVSQIEIDPESV
jgi:hypothetical protein